MQCFSCCTIDKHPRDRNYIAAIKITVVNSPKKLNLNEVLQFIGCKKFILNKNIYFLLYVSYLYLLIS